MELKQVSKWLVITGTLIIWTIKYIIRPLNFFDDPGKFFLGIAPNLFGSFLIPLQPIGFFQEGNTCLPGSSGSNLLMIFGLFACSDLGCSS